MEFEVGKILIAFLVLINPLPALSIYLDMVSELTKKDRLRVATVCSLSVFIFMLIFTLSGQFILRILGISIGAFQISGGILIFIISLSMIAGKSTHTKSFNREKTNNTTIIAPEKINQHSTINPTSIAVVPLAMPLIIGPGGISTVIIYASSTKNSWHLFSIIIASAIISFICYFTLRAAIKVGNVLGETGINIINRIMGILLSSVAIEIITSGLKAVFPILH